MSAGESGDSYVWLCSPDSFPRARCLGRRKSVAPDRRGGVRYPKVDVDRLEELGVLEGAYDPLHLAVPCLNDPWIELALDREREGGRRNQTDENQKEFHLAPLRPYPRASPPRLPCATTRARAHSHTHRERHGVARGSSQSLSITCPRDDRSSFRPVQALTARHLDASLRFSLKFQ